MAGETFDSNPAEPFQHRAHQGAQPHTLNPATYTLNPEFWACRLHRFAPFLFVRLYAPCQ